MRTVDLNIRYGSTSGPANEGYARERSFFTVYVNENVFGLDVREAQAIFRVGAITPIPLMQKEIAGLINLRGKVVVAVSLRQRLGSAIANGNCESIAIGLEEEANISLFLRNGLGMYCRFLSWREQRFRRIATRFNPATPGSCICHGSGLIPILDIQRLFDFEL